MAEKITTNPTIEALRSRLDAIENSKTLPLPTPEIGRIVWFYRQGDMTRIPIAALVTGTPAPGQLDLKLMAAKSQVVEDLSGVHFKNHPFCADEAGQKVIKMAKHGVWDYRSGDKATQAHSSLHLEALARIEKSLKAELLAEREKEIRRQDQEAAFAADRANAAVNAGGKSAKAAASA